MTTLTKYISREFIKYFLMCQTIFLSLFLVIDIVQKTDNFIEASVSGDMVFRFFLYKTPFIIQQMIPVATMISIIFLVCSMKKNNEILAIRSSGFHVIRALSPVFVITVILSIISFMFSELVVPYYSSKSNEIWDIQVEKQDTSRFYGRDQIWYKSQNGIYWIDHFDINEKLMEGPTFFFFDENFRLRQKLSAEKGVWNKGIWQLENAVVQTLDKNDRYTIERLDTFLLEIPEKPENFARRTKNPEDMSYQQLKRYTQNVKDEGYDNSIYLVDLYIKLAFPLISAVLGLIAVPIALGINRGGIPLAIALGIGICFLYLFTLSFSKSLGLSGTLPPLLSAWTSNLIFSMFGLHLIMNTNK